MSEEVEQLLRELEIQLKTALEALECCEGFIKDKANLITAAPELHEYVKMVYLSVTGGGYVVTFNDDDIEIMEAILAKVKGE